MTEPGTGDGRPRLVKLVRHRIGRFLDGRNSHVEYRPIDNHTTYIDELHKKLVEECVEYIKDPSIGELADVFEVCIALASRELGVPWQRIVAASNTKRQERGGFEQPMGMYVTSVAPATHEGDKA